MGRRHDESMTARPRPSLGRNLRRLRRAAGFSQRSLAEASDVARSSIARLESGAQASADLDTIEALALTLGVTAADLIADDELEPSGLADVRDLIDEFEARERGPRPTIHAQEDEIEWLRGQPGIFWDECPPTMETLELLVTAYRKRKASDT